MVLIWIGFVVMVLLLLAADLFLFNRKAHAVGLREALFTSLAWIGLAMAFSIVIYFGYEHHVQGLGLSGGPHHPAGLRGHEAVIIYLTGYVIEESLSIDNLFVIAMIFAYFRIPAKFQQRVLLWGIVGAQAMRGTLILVGAALIRQFEWVLYLFGALVLWSAWKIAFGNLTPNPENNVFIRLARRLFPITSEIHGQRFIVREPSPVETDAATEAGPPAARSSKTGRQAQRWVLTPLALTLIVIETSDLVFAVDSIPAIFAITTDPFLVFTSNIFAILGLRSMYFLLLGMIQKFRYLNISLAVILAFVGLKMMLRHWTDHIPHLSLWTMLLVIAALGTGIAVSLLAPALPEPNPEENSA